MPLLNFSRRTFWYLKHENRLRNGESREQCRNFIRKRGFWQGTVFGGDSFWGKMRKKSQNGGNSDIVFFLNRFSCLRYQNVRLKKLSRGHGRAYFAINFWVPFWEKGKNQALKKVIESKKVFSKSCWKFYILGSKFFLFWRNRKNAASRAKKQRFFLKIAGRLIFVISSK